MAKPSISIPDEVLEQFDREIARRQAEGEMPMTMNRSRVIRQLMKEWSEGNWTSASTVTVPAD